MYILFVIESDTRQVHYTRIHNTLAQATHDMNSAVSNQGDPRQWEIQIKRPTGADIIRMLPILP
jgi:hypothetical protein